MTSHLTPVLRGAPHAEVYENPETGVRIGPKRVYENLRNPQNVVALPRMSNRTDADALAVEPGVVVRFITGPAEVAGAGLVMLPGTRSTVAGVAWARAGPRRGSGAPSSRRPGRARHLRRLPNARDFHRRPGRERGGTDPSLGPLPVRTNFGPDKVLARAARRALADGTVVEGYEIHHGVVTREDGETPWWP